MQDNDDRDLSRPQDEPPPTPYPEPTPDPGEPGDSAASPARRKRPWTLAIGAAGALAVVVAVAISTTSGGGASTTSTSAHPTTPAQEISALLAGIPEKGNTLGSSTAPVTLQYFGDLQCSTTRAFTLEALPYIIRRWVRPGQLRIEYRSYPTVSEPEVFGVQQVAALAAGMQNKLWYYVENFYHEQGREHSGYVTENYLSTLARQVPHLNLELWGEDRHDPLLVAQVTEDEHAARAARVNSTPSFLIGHTGSTPILTLDQFATLRAVDAALRQVLHNSSDRGRKAPPTVAFAASARQHPANVTQPDVPSTSTRARAHDISDIGQTPTVGQ